MLTPSTQTPTATSHSGIEVSLNGDVLRFHLNAPSRRNALSLAAVAEMLIRLEEAGRSDEIRAILITAQGEHFCSGMDLGRDRSAKSPTPRVTATHRGIDYGPHQLIERLAGIELPVVAAVRGHASGLGMSLALSADFVIVSPTAKFTAPFIRRGFTPDSGSTHILPRLIGTTRAKEMLLLGHPVEARQAYAWGMVTRMVDDSELDAKAEELVIELAGGATTSIGLTKRLLEHNASSSLHDALRAESLTEDVATRTKDFREGIVAFLEKRSPQFQGN